MRRLPLTSDFDAVLSAFCLSLYPSLLMMSNGVETVLCRVDCGESDFWSIYIAPRIVEIVSCENSLFKV